MWARWVCKQLEADWMAVGRANTTRVLPLMVEVQAQGLPIFPHLSVAIREQLLIGDAEGRVVHRIGIFDSYGVIQSVVSQSDVIRCD